MKTMRTMLIAAGIAAIATSAFAQQKAIYTGSAGGAYKNLFCPPIPTALDGAYFKGYTCAVSKGTTDNMDRVLAQPTNIGMAQLDVFALAQREQPDKYGKLVPVRQLACEGLWMVTKNADVADYGRVLGYAKRISFVLAPGGSVASFKLLQQNDPDGLGRAKFTVAESTEQMLQRVINGNAGEVGFFVQFADPSNPNIKTIVSSGLHVVPVVSRQIMSIKQAGTDTSVYQVQSFSLTEGGFFKSGKVVNTACTPSVIFTTKAEAFTDKTDQENQRDLIQKIGELPEDKFLPRQSTIAAIIKGAKKVGGAALDEMMAATDLARKKIEDATR